MHTTVDAHGRPYTSQNGGPPTMAYLDKPAAWERAAPPGEQFARLSTPLLPPVYARLPVLTQLWLQSRLERGAAAELKNSARARRKAERRSAPGAPARRRSHGESGDGEKKRTVLRLPRGPGAHKPRLEEMEKVVALFELEQEMRAGTVLNMNNGAEAEEGADGGEHADTFLTDPHAEPRAAPDAELLEYAPSYMLPSGRLDPQAFRDAGWARPTTLANLGLQLDIVRLLWPRVWRALWAERRWAGHMALYLFRVVYDGLSGAANLWADQQMFNLVERAFKTGQRAGWDETLAAFGLALGVRGFAQAVQLLTRRAARQLETHVDFRMERAYLAAQLGMSLQARNSPLHMARVHEAGVFAGFEPQFGLERPVSGPWAMIQTLGDAVSLTIQVGLQGAMLGRMLWSTLSGDPAYRWGNGALLALSLAPTLLQLGHDRFVDWLAGQEGGFVDQTPVRVEQAARAFATDSQYTLELVLFGLKDWVLAQWEAARRVIIARQLAYARRTEGLGDGAFALLHSCVHYGFYALLATQSVSTSFSLGALHAHAEMSREALFSVQEWRGCWQGVAQIPYYLAAFVASVDDDAAFGPALDYEARRLPAGMRIEASGLGFTYPGADAATLRDVNLTIEPGQTVAIVGSNGSGKTTLVKALLGLHGHSGSLRVNGTEIDDYDHTTLHARMSCLFQDYCKYQMSLRVNVGLGDTSHMDDNRAVRRAIRRGGARPILAKVGLEGQLNPFQQPRDSGRRQPRRRRGSSNRPDVKADGAGTPLTPVPATPAPEAEAEGAPLTEANLDAVAEAVAAEDPADSASDSDAGSAIVVREPVPGEIDVGTCISGGQWQRVALSRAFMRAESADLVVFDEPSASLDPKAESELFDRIHSLSRQNSTTIFISHRYATVKRADKIAFVEGGTIIEFGSHRELMDKKGKYCEMYTLQADAFR